MIEFEATYSFNVRRFLKVKIEAETPEEAERLAKEQAEKHIDAEILRLQNSGEFGDAAPLDPYLFLDFKDPDMADEMVVFEGPIEGIDEE